MAKRTYDERIEELMRKQEQLKAQERQLKKLQNVEERKKRTKSGLFSESRKQTEAFSLKR